MKHCDLLVTHGLVVDARDGVREDAALAVKGNRLVAVGSTSELSSRYNPGRRLDAGGKVVVTGSPEDIIKNKKSYTAKFLREKLTNN